MSHGLEAARSPCHTSLMVVVHGHHAVARAKLDFVLAVVELDMRAPLVDVELAERAGWHADLYEDNSRRFFAADVRVANRNHHRHRAGGDVSQVLDADVGIKLDRP